VSVKNVDHCPICLVDFDEEEQGVVTTCQGPKWTHRVCKDPCFQNWVNAGHPDCPQCRRTFEVVELKNLDVTVPGEAASARWISVDTVLKVGLVVSLTLTYISLCMLLYNECKNDPKFCERVANARDPW
jgi:hypothetical protein